MSRLFGVDISGYQEGIDVASLTADFVIVKSTEGVQGTVYNPTYRHMADVALVSGKLLGFYHYANGGDPIAEADCFYDSIRDYQGRAIAALDWEGKGNPLFGKSGEVLWCKRFLDRLKSRFGGTPLLYTSKSVCNSRDWSAVASEYPLWGAEYAYDNYVWKGYPYEPWQSKLSWGAWGKKVTIHQFGYVDPKPNNGGMVPLDGDVLDGDRGTWESLCGNSEPKPKPCMTIRESMVELARAELGADYYSMNYSSDVGYAGWMGTNYVGLGWGCAQGGAYYHNAILGTKYVGSCWNFAGDALGNPELNQGGGQFRFIDESEALPGDLVIYVLRGYDGRDAEDYAHIGIYVGNGRVISALGTGKPGESGYVNIGMSEHDTNYCCVMRGSSLGWYRFLRCTLLDGESDDKGDIMASTTMTMLIHPKGQDKIYYWDGSPECVPFHVSPNQKAAIEAVYELANGRKIPFIEVDASKFNELMKMCKARMTWREGEMADKINGKK